MNWTVSRRIVLGFALVLGLTALVAGAGAIALRNAVRAYSAALLQERTVVDAALRAKAAAQEASIYDLRFLLDPRAEFARGRDSATAEAQRLVEGLRATTTGQLQADFAQVLELLRRWDAAIRTTRGPTAAQSREQNVQEWAEQILPLRVAAGDLIDRGIVDARALGSEAEQAAADAARRMQWLLVISAGGALALGVLSAWRLNRSITGPLRETTGVLASSAAEILAATSQQASSATETSAAVAQTSTTVDEVARTAEHAAERARAVAESARRAAEIGKSGRQAVEASIAAMDGVKAQVQGIAESILALAEQAQTIGEIITTVNDVADRIHLLALNAAVEAARAGEHGRGFAVVAGEVRGLADESKQATVKVRQILGEIQRATNTAVMTTERGSHEVAAGVKQVDEAGETIRALADAVAEAAQAAAQIVASASEQAAGMSQIRHAMENVQEATHQTLASTRQAEQAAQDLNRLGSRLLEMVGQRRNGSRYAGRA
ncbi:MAG: hypothetical protein IRZ00_09520 [Gemmatimonadetes bacterium]|nr:hypothetical protein [Gemmatimonadota bacterium]